MGILQLLELDLSLRLTPIQDYYLLLLYRLSAVESIHEVHGVGLGGGGTVVLQDKLLIVCPQDFLYNQALLLLVQNPLLRVLVHLLARLVILRLPVFAFMTVGIGTVGGERLLALLQPRLGL